jgi:hypothetical protein
MPKKKKDAKADNTFLALLGLGILMLLFALLATANQGAW